MDQEGDQGWDGPQIRPPQAASSDDKSQRSRGSSSNKRDRQVFVSNRRDERSSGSKSHDHRRHQDSHSQHRRHGEDLRNRLNRNAASSRHTSKDRSRSRDTKRPSNSRRAPPRSSEGNRDEREMRVQRLMNASAAKAESRRDIQVRRQRRMMEREAREAENRVKRKRDKSRDRQDSSGQKYKTSAAGIEEPSRVKRPRGKEVSNDDDDTEEEDSDDETESGEESSKSEEDTASEQSGATPEHNDGSGSEDDDEGEEGEEEEESGDTETGSESEHQKVNTKSDQSRSPSRSPTPMRQSDEEGNYNVLSQAKLKDDNVPTVSPSSRDRPNNFSPASPAITRDLRDDLPPYLPSINGCRSVEEFHCLNRIEEGTYGVVYRARDKKTSEIVALKRLKMEREKSGFPITSLREINTLLISQHQNVVHIREIVVGSNMDKIFIVMDFVEHDMKSLMETMRRKKQVFLPGEVKCLMTQLLAAVAHLHDNWILHRDLKTSNLLLSHNGILKVGDFGLAREYGSPLKAYTGIVVTLWYRSPELLLGIKEYSTFIDVWSIGCIFGEFLLMNPLFPGKSDIDQLEKVFKLLGTPNQKIWDGYNSLPAVQKMKFVDYPISHLRNKFSREMLSDKGLELLRQFLTYDPKKRISCDTALRHPYFDETPLAIDPSMFPTWPAKSEEGPASGKKASSPKPPSGGGAFKKINDDDDDAHLGFQINATIAFQPAPAGWNLRF